VASFRGLNENRVIGKVHARTPNHDGDLIVLRPITEAAARPYVFDALPNRAIPVSCDQTVAAHHAIIRHEVRNSAVSQTGGRQVLIKREPVDRRQAVYSGERIDIGETLFVVHKRAQAVQS
jgi:hypothetical protein